MTEQGTGIPRIATDLWRKARTANVPRVVVIGVFLDARKRLLTSTFRDGVSNAVLHRPPGGGVHFGELLREALARELHEELGQPATVGAPLGVFEDRFLHEGQPGHEIVHAFEATFHDPGLHGSEDLTLVDDGLHMPVGWYPVTHFAPGGSLTLCPPGLADLLLRHDPT
ncbi:NUDIX domain-containing protein [Streptomyces sp. NPDC021224]|uniref:NUDIX domain-containing protein n=1 Tax=unclassified Streptomyces TaxID=2593676 RepID=UPI00378D31BC